MDSVDTSIAVAVATQKRGIMWKPALRDRATLDSYELSFVSSSTPNDKRHLFPLNRQPTRSSPQGRLYSEAGGGEIKVKCQRNFTVNDNL